MPRRSPTSRSTASRRSAAASPCSIAWPIRANISSSATASARPKRRRRSRRMMAKGVKISAGTDATRVASYNPVGLAGLARHRQDRRRACASIRTRNCLDRETALRMWTENVTWFSNEEGKKGRIEVGQFADLIVPDRDYFACAERRNRRHDVAISRSSAARSSMAPATLHRFDEARRRRRCRTGRRSGPSAATAPGRHKTMPAKPCVMHSWPQTCGCGTRCAVSTATITRIAWSSRLPIADLEVFLGRARLRLLGGTDAIS